MYLVSFALHTSFNGIAQPASVLMGNLTLPNLVNLDNPPSETGRLDRLGLGAHASCVPKMGI